MCVVVILAQSRCGCMWARGRCTCGRADGTDVCGWTDETKAAATRIGSPNVVDGRRRTRRSFSLRVLLSSLSPHILVHTIWPSLRHTTHAYHIFRQPIRFGLWASSFVSHRVKLCLWDRCLISSHRVLLIALSACVRLGFSVPACTYLTYLCYVYSVHLIVFRPVTRQADAVLSM